MNELSKQMNKFLYGEELEKALTILPSVRECQTINDRFLALNDIYSIFIPNKTIYEIYNRIYLSLIGALDKKETINEVKLFNNNFLAVNGRKQNGVANGFNSFSITGESGCGKTTTVRKVIDVITGGKIIYGNNGYREIIPILVVECPSDNSFKQLLFSIMRGVDNILGTNYLVSNNKTTATIDMLLGSTSNILNSSVGMLIIDEIDRLANENKNSEKLLNYLTQLINITNTHIIFVGNTSALSYFSKKTYLARRTIGVCFEKAIYDEWFCSFLLELFRYQYTEKITELNAEISMLFYKLSNGNPSIVVSLFVETQRQCLLNGMKQMNSQIIEQTFNKCFAVASSFKISEEKVYRPVSKINEIKGESLSNKEYTNLFETMSRIAHKDTNKAILFLKESISVEYA